MDRREFFKSTVAGVALCATPLAHSSVPQTTAQLVAWFEDNFRCEYGGPLKYDYVAYQLAASTDVSEAALVGMFWRNFSRITKQHPELRGSLLYWRNTDKISVADVASTLEKTEVASDGGFVQRFIDVPMRRLRTRFYAPTLVALGSGVVAFEKPEGEKPLYAAQE